MNIICQSIHFRQISFFKITQDIQSNDNNNIVLSMLCLLTMGHISAYTLPFGSCIMPWDIFRHITWTTQYYCINMLVRFEKRKL